jgi:lysine 6-dehydrogenase
MPRACLVGYGRVGRVTAAEAARRGYSVTVYDSSRANVEAARSAGYEARLADASSSRVAEEIAAGCDVVAVSLPGLVATQVARSLLEAGASLVVDVSYVPDPFALQGLAEKRGAALVVDAGLAPGLSNMLLYHSAGQLEEPREALVYVGGVAAEHEAAPLGLVASWNVEDMLEEYTRPARARLGGSLVSLDPLADATRVEVPGAGVFEALPTDGLRTLLATLREPRTMVEYTLRYPGHVEAFLQLRALGLLEDRSYVVEGCSSSPRKLLARLLEERLPRQGDRVVLYTRVSGRGGGGESTLEYYLDTSQAGLGLKDVTALAFLTGFMHAWFLDRLYRLRGSLGPGVVPPEMLHEYLFEAVGELRERGVVVARRICVED